MRLLVDADGCPVVDICLKLCRKYHTECILLCDTAHEFHKEGIQTLVFDKGADSVDYAIANRVTREDLVVTQDYGLASMGLAKGASVIHQNGWMYTGDNIDALMFECHESRKFRASGGRTKGPKKRTAENDRVFENSLEKLLQTTVQGYTASGSLEKVRYSPVTGWVKPSR